MAEKLKLTYFNGRGRAEITRLVFACADKPFEDERIAQENWPQEKPKRLFGWLPILTVGKEEYCDSMGIARYVAREFGLGGKTNLEMLQIDMVLGMVSDVIGQLINVLFQSDQDAKKKMEEEVFKGTLPKFLGALEKIITKNGGNFFVGKSITVADLAVFDMADMNKIPDDILKQYPLVKANVGKVAANKNIADYLKKRPETMF